MDFDKNSLAKLLSLNDEELMKVLKDIAKESVINTSNMKIGQGEVMKIRAFLSMASSDDIARLISNFGGNNNGRRN